MTQATIGGRWPADFATGVAVLGALAFLPVPFWIFETWLGGLLGGAAAGLLTIPICMVLSWLAYNRPAWRRATADRAGADWAMLGVLAVNGVGLLLARDRWDALLLSAVMLPLAVWVWIWGALGLGKARAMMVPVFFAWFALPWEHFLRQAVDIPLQRYSAEIAAILLGFAGYPVGFYDEYTIYSEKFYVIVNETCSGMNMLITLGMYTLLFAWITQPSFKNRLWLLALVPLLAMTANGLRIAVIYVMGHYGGTELAMGFWHTGSAYLIFLPVFWFIYVANNALTRRWKLRRAAVAN